MAKKYQAILLAVTLLFSMALPAFAEEQPHMQAALQALQNAEQELQKATHDKGGHREKALQEVHEAIAQVKAGMHYDNDNHEKHPHK